MMNPSYHFARMRELLDEYEPSRAKSLAATKLDECEFWLANATPTELARQRDGVAPAEAEPAPDYRALLDKATTAHHNVGLPGEQKTANAHRREAGLEEL
jgi:hypothetical protein